MRNLLSTCGYLPTCLIDPEINLNFGLRINVFIKLLQIWVLIIGTDLLTCLQWS